MTRDEGRCDYVRLMLPFEAGKKVEAQLEYENLANDVCAHWGLAFTCYDVHSFYERSTRTWMAFFNIWGEAAHQFLYAMPLGWFSRVQRLDYRMNIGENVIDFRNLYNIMELRAGSRTTVKRITSPIRNKRKGRDTGGQGIVCGGEQSRKRLSVYQRAHEGACVEGQFSSTDVKKLLTDALGGDIPTDKLPATLVLGRLEEATEKLFQKYAGSSLSDIAGGIFDQVGTLDHEPVEKVLSQMDMLWDLLNDEAQEAFIEQHTSADAADIARALEAVRFVKEADWQDDIADTVYQDTPEYAAAVRFLEDDPNVPMREANGTYNY